MHTCMYVCASACSRGALESNQRLNQLQRPPQVPILVAVWWLV